MNSFFSRVAQPSIVRSLFVRLGLCMVVAGFVPLLAQAQDATSTALTVRVGATAGVGGTVSSSSAIGVVQTLTAVVTDTTATATVTLPGTVVFCDDAATQGTGGGGVCGVRAQLGTAQITAAGTAFISLRLAPGSHILYAKFAGAPGAALPLLPSTSYTAATANYAVDTTATNYPLASVLTSTGSASSGYVLTDTVVNDPAAAAPTGSVNFVDTTPTTPVSVGTGTLGSTTAFSFSPPAVYVPNFGSGFNGTRAIATADFNLDGYADLMSFSEGSGAEFEEYLGSTTVPGTFVGQTPGGSLHTGNLALVGDFNNDGYPDVAYVTTNGIYVLINKGAGGGFTEGTVSTTTVARSIAIGDFNGDGNLDIAVSGVGTSDEVQIFTGNGDGTFTAGPTFTPPAGSTIPIYGLGAADFNGDGYSDLIVGSYTSPNLTTLYYQNAGAPGAVAFAAPVQVGAGTSAGYPYLFYVADMQNNGVLDIVWGSNAGANVALNTAAANTTPTFPAIVSTAYTNDSNAYGFALGDFNNDGSLDAVAGNAAGQIVYFAGSSATGALSAPVYSTIQGGTTIAYGIAVGDFTGSGVPDIATANQAIGDPIGIIFPGDLTTATSAAVTVSGHVANSVNSVATTNYTSTSTSNAVSLLPAGSMSLTVSPGNTSASGANVTLTATIQPATIAGGPAPTGTVTFYDGSTALGSYTLTGSENGVATYSTTALTTGSHALSAQYTGDSNYTAFSATNPLISPTLSYTVTGSASQLVFSSFPDGNGSTIPNGSNAGILTAAVEDASGNIYPVSDSLQLVVSTSPAVPGYPMTYTTTASGGVGTFDLTTVPLIVPTPPVTFTYTLTDLTNGALTSVPDTLVVTASASGLVYTVTDFNDPDTANSPACTNQAAPGATLDSYCTLRVALTLAQPTSAAGSTITFSNANAGGSWPQTIHLSATFQSSSSPDLEPYGITISGPGPQNLFISGATAAALTTPAYGIFKEHTSPTQPFNLSGMTLEYAKSASNGAALYIYGTTNINNVNFYGNAGGASSGGGIYANTGDTGNLTITNSTFEGNSSTASGGGAISYAGTAQLIVNNSAFIGNTDAGSGGAISATGGGTGVVITNSYFYNNQSTADDGGALNINISGNTTTNTLTNDTFYGNSAVGEYGGAIYLGGGSSDLSNNTLTNVTVVGNDVTNPATPSKSYGGGIYSNADSNIVLINSVLADNTAAAGAGGNADLYFSSSRTETITNTIQTSTSGTSNYTSLAAIGLTAPGDYGGTATVPVNSVANPATGGNAVTFAHVPVMAVLPGSPALKLGNGVSTVTTDQRGFARPASGTNTVDAGAVQSNLGVVFTSEPANTTVGATFSPAPAVEATESGYALAGVPFTATLDPGTLTGTTTVSTDGTGTASFSSLSSSTPEMGTELYISAGSGLSTVGATSTPFNIVGTTIAKLGFTTAPATPIAAGGNAGTAVTVQEEDSGGNALSGTDTITLTVTYPNATQQVYTQAATGGAAVFNLSGVALTAAGSYGYSATSGTLTPATATEVVVAGAATQFGFTHHYSTFNPGIADSMTVIAEDGYGNTVTSYNGPVTLSSATDPTVTFSTGTTVTVANGVGSFTATFDTAGNQTIKASDGVISGTSSTLYVADYVWVVNTTGTLSQIYVGGTSPGAVGNTGTASTLGGVAIDGSGNLWSVTSGNNTLNSVSKTGTGSASYSGGGLNAPVGVAVDGQGYIWVVNSGTNTVSVFNNAGADQSGGVGGYGTASLGAGPSGIAIDKTGGVWVTSGTGNSVTHIFGAATPVTTPTSAAVQGAKLGATP